MFEVDSQARYLYLESQVPMPEQKLQDIGPGHIFLTELGPRSRPRSRGVRDHARLPNGLL